MTRLPEGDDLFTDMVDRRIARMVLEGAPNKAIARAVGLAEGTVKWRLHRLYRRLGVSSRASFVMALRDMAEEG